MVTKVPQIQEGRTTFHYVTSDHATFTNPEEANWHEFSVCQLKQRQITIDIPEHDVYHFENRNIMEKFFQENYGHLHVQIVSDTTQFTFPNDYVFIENEVAEKNRNAYFVEIHPLENFKKQLIIKMLEL